MVVEREWLDKQTCQNGCSVTKACVLPQRSFVIVTDQPCQITGLPVCMQTDWEQYKPKQGRQTDRQMYGHIDRQTGRQKDRARGLGRALADNSLHLQHFVWLQCPMVRETDDEGSERLLICTTSAISHRIVLWLAGSWSCRWIHVFCSCRQDKTSQST